MAVNVGRVIAAALLIQIANRVRVMESIRRSLDDRLKVLVKHKAELIALVEKAVAATEGEIRHGLATQHAADIDIANLDERLHGCENALLKLSFQAGQLFEGSAISACGTTPANPVPEGKTESALQEPAAVPVSNAGAVLVPRCSPAPAEWNMPAVHTALSAPQVEIPMTSMAPPPQSQPSFAGPWQPGQMTLTPYPTQTMEHSELAGALFTASSTSPVWGDTQMPLYGMSFTGTNTMQWHVPVAEWPMPVTSAEMAPAVMSAEMSVGVAWPALSSSLAVVLPPHAFQAVVSEVETPWLLYVQTVSQSLIELNQHIAAMVQTVYALPAYQTPPKVGCFCLAPFIGQYYRAQVQKILDYGTGENLVMVFFVDYGNKAEVKMVELIPLSPDLTSLPPQAVACAVAEVAPLPAKQGIWTEKEMLALRERVDSKLLVCQMVHPGDIRTGNVHLVSLHLSDAAVPSVKDQLVQSGNAMAVSLEEQLAVMAQYHQRLSSLDHQVSGTDSGLDWSAMQLAKAPSKKKSPKHAGLQRAKDKKSSTAKSHQNTAITDGSLPSGVRRAGELCSSTPHVQPQRLQSPAPSSHSKASSSVLHLDDVMPTDSSYYAQLARASSFGCETNSSNAGVSRNDDWEAMHDWETSAEMHEVLKSVALNAFGKDSDSGLGTEVMRRHGDGRKVKVSGRTTPEDEYAFPPFRGRPVNKGAERMKQGRRWSDDSDGGDDDDDNLARDKRKVQVRSSAPRSENARKVSPKFTKEECLEKRAKENRDFIERELQMADISCLATHVNSPSEIFVFIDSDENGKRLETVVKTLHSKVGCLGKKKRAKLQNSFTCTEGALCCGLLEGDPEYFRGQVLSMEESSGDSFVHVRAIDFGETHKVHRSQLYPLPEEMASIEPLAVRCSLRGICPTSSSSTNSSGWSSEAIDYFKSLVPCNSKLIASIKNQDLLLLKNQGMKRQQQLPAFEVFLAKEEKGSERSINLDLVDKGFARSCRVLDAGDVAGDVADSPMDQQEKPDLVCWDPMKADHHSLRNSYNVDTDDIGVATMGYKAQDERHICRFFNRGNCWRGEHCHLRHIPFPSGGVTYDRQELPKLNVDQGSLLPREGSLVCVEVSCILTPQHFYVTLPFGNTPLNNILNGKSSEPWQQEEFETLDMLNAAMNRHYKRSQLPDSDLTVPAVSQAVVARFDDDDGNWYRALVLDANPEEESVKVFYVDIGCRRWVDEREIRAIKPEFVHLPIQAVEVMLQGVQPAKDIWTQAANEYFKCLVDKKTLVAHVLKSLPCGTLYVEVYDTEQSAQDVSLADKLIESGFARPASPIFTASSLEQRTARPTSLFAVSSLLPG